MSEALVATLDQNAGPATGQLRAVLSRALERSGSRVRIVDIERAPCPNGSSWWLEEITLDLDDNSQISLVFKDLVRETTGSSARRVKPAFVTDPTREPWVYEHVLIDAISGPPKLWAAVTDLPAGRHWLFIERVNGAPLAQVGDRHAWCAAAEWLGKFHGTAPVRRATRGPLLRHEEEFHRRWLARAIRAAHQEARTSDTNREMAREKHARLRAIAPAHERAIELALTAGSSVIHGEFYASNVLVDQSAAPIAVHPVDWEMAAIGPPLLDLAALMSGRWSPDDRGAMAVAYLEGARSAGLRARVLGDVLAEVTACQLLLAVQWLGWAVDWTAPADHRNDWLEEAERCARELRG